MNTEGTTRVLIEGAAGGAASYVEGVRAALADLGPQEVDDLTSGMEADLGELLADRGGSLERLLGAPDRYAEELRAAAGLPGPPGPARALDVGAWVRRRRASAATAVDARPWLRPVVDAVASLRPAWWLVRAFLGAVTVVWLLGRGFIPSLEYRRTALTVTFIVLAVVSVWLGRRPGTPGSGPGRPWTRLLGLGLLAASVMGALVVSITPVSQPVVFDDPGYSPGVVTVDGRPVANLYPYDAQGHRLSDVRLYDDQGQPVLVAPSGPEQPTRPVDVYGTPYGNVVPQPAGDPALSTLTPPSSIAPLATPTGGVTVTATTTAPAPTISTPSTTSATTP